MILQDTACNASHMHYSSTVLPVFEFQNWNANTQVEYKATKLAVLVFVMRGNIQITTDQVIDLSVDEGKLFFIPPHSFIQAVFKRSSQTLICRLDNIAHLHSHFNLSRIVNEEQPTCFFALNIHSRINTYITSLQEVMNDGISDYSFMDIKLNELLCYLRCYYSDQETLMLFSSITSEDISFSSLVMKYLKEIKTVDELAHKCNYSASGFSKRFIKVFGISPYQWIKIQKNHGILYDIKSTQKHFLEISEAHGFSSLCYFYTFCKREFGLTPNELRHASS